MQHRASVSNELNHLTQQISAIAANDEIELRVAVHHLQQYNHQCSKQTSHIPDYHELLLSACTEISSKQQQKLTLETLPSYRHKPYVCSLNALLKNLLPQVLDSQPGLCLDGLELDHCSMAHIGLPFSSFRFIDLTSSNISHADLQNSDIYHANAMSTNFSHSNLSFCTLSKSNFNWADFSYARLYHITAVDMNMNNSILTHSNMSHSVLSGTRFHSATLNHADLSYSNLFGAEFQHCKLEATDLRGTGITEQRLHSAGMEVFQTSHTLWGLDTDCGGRNPLASEYYNQASSSLG